MEIYSINIDGKKYKQYKNYEDAESDMNKLIELNKNSHIEIILEDFCDYGHFDYCCKIYLLCEYKNLLIKKYL